MPNERRPQSHLHMHSSADTRPGGHDCLLHTGRSPRSPAGRRSLKFEAPRTNAISAGPPMTSKRCALRHPPQSFLGPRGATAVLIPPLASIIIITSWPTKRFVAVPPSKTSRDDNSLKSPEIPIKTNSSITLSDRDFRLEQTGGVIFR
jgi:hypothetical protein